MITIGLIALSLSQLLVNPAPRAWHATPALRPLTEAEAWDYAVARSDAIGVGRIRSVRQASPEVAAPVDLGVVYRTTYELSFLPARWLKGRMPVTTQSLRCSRDRLRTGDEDTALEGLIDKLVLVFLLAADDGLHVFESPEVSQDGLFLIPENELDEIADRIALAERRNSLDSLVAAADLVVIGASMPGETSPCRAAGRNARCSLLGIEERLAGMNVETRIVAYGMHGALPAGRSLFFLRRTEEGFYETVPFYAGILPIQGQSVPLLGMGTSEVDFEIRRIARLLANPEPIAPFAPTTVGGVDSTR